MIKHAQQAAKPGDTPMTNWRAKALNAVAALMLWGFGAGAWAQNAIQSIQALQQSGSDVIRIQLVEPLAEVPKGFTIQSPARVAIDLPGIANNTGKSILDINQGNIRSINVASTGERTRVVLNLKQSSTYRAQLQGNLLLLILEDQPASMAPVPVSTSASAAPVNFSPVVNRQVQSLQIIDFRRVTDGSGRVIVDLPSNQVGVDIRQQGQNLVVEFMKTTVPDALRRRLNVADFGTPVQTITATSAGDRVRMVVEPRGNWEHSAYQTDNQFVLEVRPQKNDPNKLTKGSGYSGEKLSLNFQNIEVRALLQVIADFTNFNVVTSDSVTGTVTLRLKDVPWDQAMDIILQAKGLGQRKTGNVIWIAPKDELAAKEKLDLEAKAQISQLEPLRTQAFQLNYTKAEEVSKGISGQNTSGGGGANGQATRILSPRGSVISESRTNQVFVTDIPAKLEEIQNLISKIDIPVRQVLIEARIVEATDSFGRSLGVRLGGADMRGIRGGLPGYGLGGDNRVTVGGNLNAVGSQTQQITGTTLPFNDTRFVNLPATGQNNFDAATFALTLFGAASNRFLNLELSALEADGKGRIVSSPRVITADQVKALIEQGEELPYQTATSSGATALQFRKANLKLEVTPQITPEGNVILDVDVNKDSVGRVTAAGFAIDTKHVQTQVLVENGGTVVIGGIFTQVEREDVTKVPFLGDIPYVGNLFKTKTRSNNKTELLIFLTPKVITDRTTAR